MVKSKMAATGWLFLSNVNTFSTTFTMKNNSQIANLWYLCDHVFIGVNKQGSQRHNPARETPLPIYVALKVHAETRKRGLVDALHGLGLCISYDHTLAISTDDANSLCARFESEGVVCPPQAVTGVFTTAAVDNTDHKPSSTTSQGSFHGTTMSLLKHPTQQFPGTPRAVTVIDNNLEGQCALSTLPDAYTLVNPVALPSPDSLVPPVAASMQLQPPTELNQLNSFSSWLIDTKDTLLKPELQENDMVPWDTYSSSQHEEHPHPVTPAYLLSRFPEAAHSVAMIFHAMNVVKAVVAHI